MSSIISALVGTLESVGLRVVATYGLISLHRFRATAIRGNMRVDSELRVLPLILAILWRCGAVDRSGSLCCGFVDSRGRRLAILWRCVAANSVGSLRCSFVDSRGRRFDIFSGVVATNRIGSLCCDFVDSCGRRFAIFSGVFATNRIGSLWSLLTGVGLTCGFFFFRERCGFGSSNSLVLII
jgi:hypothetical protein